MKYLYFNINTHDMFPIHCSLLLADDGLAVVTGHVIEARSALDDDGETVLVALGVVGLAGTPPVLGGGPAAGPAHAPRSMVDGAAGPEVGLSLPHQQAGELPLLGRAVQGHGGHPVGLAVGGGLASREGGAAQPPGDQELLASEGVIGFTVTTGATSTSSPSNSLGRSPSTGTTRPSSQATEEVGQTSEEALRVYRGQRGEEEERRECCWFHAAGTTTDI